MSTEQEFAFLDTLDFEDISSRNLEVEQQATQAACLVDDDECESCKI